MTTAPRDELLAVLARDRGADLVAYACLLTGDQRAAEDLVQDALVKVVARARAGFAPDTLEAYVRRAILTTYLDGYRRRRRWAQIRHLTADPDVRTGPELDTPARVDLHRALGTLSRQERAAVVLRFYSDLTVPDVAAAMGLGDGTVKRYLSNATRKLERVLGPLEADDEPGTPTVAVTRPSTTAVPPAPRTRS